MQTFMCISPQLCNNYIPPIIIINYNNAIETSYHFFHLLLIYTYIILMEIINANMQGCAVIIPAYPPNHDISTLNLQPEMNEGQPIHFLISAPTMRIPTNVSKTVNSYLAMRAVLQEGLFNVCIVPLLM